MRAQVLRSDFSLIAIEAACEVPELGWILLTRTFRGDRPLLGPRMHIQREVLPDQVHAALVSRVDDRFDFVESVRAVWALEVAEFDYRDRSVGRTKCRAVVQMHRLQVRPFPRVGPIDDRIMLRDQ